MAKEEKQAKRQKPAETAAERAAREERERKFSNNIYHGVVAVVVVAIVISIGILIFRNTADYMGTYLKIGDYEISKEELDFYYNGYVTSWESSYLTYYSYLGYIDTSLEYSEQYYSDDLTWEDYFIECAVEEMQTVYAWYDAAMDDEDFTYDVDELVQEQIDALQEGADDSDVSLSYYVKAYYGVSVSKFKKYIKKTVIATEYYDYLEETYEVTDEDIQTELEDNAEDYTLATYRYYSISYATDSDATDEEAEEYQEYVLTNTELIAAQITDEDSYLEMVAAYEADDDYDADSSTLAEDATVSDVTDVIAIWLMEAERTEGDVTILDDTSSSVYYLVYFKSCALDDTKSAAFRHILLTDDYAEENAEIMLEYWEENYGDEETFAEMADRYSEDSAEGGLYEDVYNGEMVDVINDWVLDESRQAGDTTIVTSSYGTHIVYLVSTSDTLSIEIMAKNNLTTAYLTDLLEEIQESMPVEDVKGKIAYLASDTDAE
ncbi:MAG: peptidylprolyl isomerase [Lachnospiraceae bacterium]|nr:peptidylprolyl isomerase [Lachnospiraceae bacterium]